MLSAWRDDRRSYAERDIEIVRKLYVAMRQERKKTMSVERESPICLRFKGRVR